VFGSEKDTTEPDDKMMVDFVSVKETKTATFTAARKAAAAAALEKQMALETDEPSVFVVPTVLDEGKKLKTKKSKLSERMVVDEDVTAPEKVRAVKFAPETKMSTGDQPIKKKAFKAISSSTTTTTITTAEDFDWSMLQ